MSRVTSKLQITVPKAIADQYGIRPGDEIEWVAAGDTIPVTDRILTTHVGSLPRLPALGDLLLKKEFA